MAIVRSAGTEIIRSAHFEDIDSTPKKIIIGEQHHIYTILSIIIYMQSSNTAGTNVVNMRYHGYDAYGGDTAQEFLLLKETIVAGKTFVWNDKFSFNGYEPTNYTGGALTTTMQNAIADQGSSVAQYIDMYTTHADDICEAHITFIDQNNA